MVRYYPCIFVFFIGGIFGDWLLADFDSKNAIPLTMPSATTHPFLDNSLPINWALLTPEAAQVDIPIALERASEQIAKIAAIEAEKATFANSFVALDKAADELGRAWGLLENLKSLADSPEVRRVHTALLPKITQFNTELFLNSNLYNVLLAAKGNTPEDQLSPSEKRFAHEMLENFREQGVDLPSDKKEAFKAINQQLAEITQKFSENVLDATKAWELVITEEASLAGLPESARAAALQDALKKGKGTKEKPAWRFTLQMPSYAAVMTYLDDEQIRRQVWSAMNDVGRLPPYDNRPLIKEILKLRSALAALLGKDHFSDYVLSRRMAKTGQAALAFIEKLQERIEPAFKREHEVLMHFRADSLGLKTPEKLEPWDAAYWAEKLRKKNFDFDAELLRPYFPEDHVTMGLFNLAGHVFGIQIRQIPVPADTLWNEAVKYYSIIDNKTQQILGYFYTDWHPRDNKKSGAWMNPLITAGPLLNEPFAPHIGIITGNFTSPIGDNAALLLHGEVKTAFHEFGHLLHHIFTEVPLRGLAAMNVAWDFIEFPSQLMENWCWERTSLDLFARHYKTDEALPEDLFRKMKAARNFMAAASRMRQLMLAKLDLDFHLHPEDYAELSSEALEEKIQAVTKDYLPPFKTPSPSIAPRFTHVFGSPVGYASAYYSYQWAEVLEADAFSRFQSAAEGVLSAVMGERLRQSILCRGNSCDPDVLFKDFMGREPDFDALLRRDGLMEE